MTDPTEEHRRRLARDLASKRALRSPEWRLAFERVPRHLFVPRFHLEWEDRTLDGSDPEQRDEWLDVLLGPEGFRHFRGRPAIERPAAVALDPGTARQLWDLSAQLTGL